jgi:hypothetical protein
MAAPTTTDEFLALLRKSGLVDDDGLTPCLERLRADPGLPARPADCARELVREGLLTPFQANQLLRGKWRGFFLGKYQLLEPIGSGGMGRVFLAEHRVMRRPVALKLLAPGQAGEPGAVQRLQREAQAAAALDHPNIVRAYDIDQDDGLHFLVLEYVAGVSLQDVVDRHGPLAVGRAVDCVRQAARGLEHAHRAGWIHRDVKPGNLLIDRHGVVKILDMGLARLVAGRQKPLTRTFDVRNVLGTADYLAPEQVLDSHEVDARADVYSLGCMFYFLLTGSAPFEERSLTGKLFGHQVAEPRPLGARRPGLPEGLAAVVGKMMAKHPSQRYQGMAEVLEALSAWPPPAAPPPPEELPPVSAAVRALVLARASAEGVGPETSSGGPWAAVLAAPAESAAERAAGDTPPPGHGPVGVPERTRVEPARALTGPALVLLAAGQAAPPPADPLARGRWTWRALAAGWVILAGVLSTAVCWAVFLRAAPQPDGAVPAREAVRHTGERRTVLLHVNSTGSFGSPALVFLNSEADYRRDDNFAAVIAPQAAEQLEKELQGDPKSRYLGKDVRVTGPIMLYRGRPQILVDDPRAIRVAGE